MKKVALGPKIVVYPTPAFVVTTYDSVGKPNAMTVAWGSICCSEPPCIGVSMRKATYTYKNMIEKRAFVVNIASERYVKEVDFFGIVTGKRVDKFEATGLTPVKSEIVDAPYIQEFPFCLACKLLHTFELGLHTLFVGEIIDVMADEAVLNEDKTIEIEKVKPLIYAPEIKRYYGIGSMLGDGFAIGKGLKR